MRLSPVGFDSLLFSRLWTEDRITKDLTDSCSDHWGRRLASQRTIARGIYKRDPLKNAF
jgi:hypothetical protein